MTFTSCISVKSYNKRLETPIAPEKLRADVDFTYHNLQKLHPHLYDFISKERLDFKFDSLKISLTKNVNPREFYQKLAPVISEVRQGHLRLVAPEKRLTRKQTRDLKNQKGLFSRYNFVVDKDRIFVKDNPDKIKNMNVGTEILKINDENVFEMLNRYRPFITSDGFNTTYDKYSLSRRWPTFFTIEKGILDSIKLETRYKDSQSTFYLKREKITKSEKKTVAKTVKKKKEERKNDDYNALTKSYNRDLSFKTKDSSIAVMTIKTFSGFRSQKFYKHSFEALKKGKTKYLILDIRNNLGGSLAEITNLYSYLGANQYPFIKDIEVTSRTSMFHADYFKEFPSFTKPLGVIGYPFYLIGTMFSTKRIGDKFYLRNNGIFSIKKPKANAFHGKMFVLINGSSFSASSIISSKLKNDKRAILVGEETGGANDGTVAGRYSTKKLPNTHLVLPIGLMMIQPNIEFTNTMKGVVPDVEIAPTLDEVLKKKDVEMAWILEEIKRNPR